MARRRKPRSKPQAVSPEDCISGRVELDRDSLIELIHHVNPTDQNLSQQQRAERYRQKNQLQSQLVERFRNDLEVVPTDKEGVVGLLCRPSGRDACHAVFSELAPKARSWVQFQLDVAQHLRRADVALQSSWSQISDDVAPSTSTPAEWLARGRKALLEYDYEAAESCFLKAWDGTRGSPETVLPLFELWVEVLGLDDQVCEREAELSSGALNDSRIRILLALANARRGRALRASELIRGQRGSGVAEVCAVLAEQALRDRDVATTEDHLARLRDQDAQHPQLQHIEAQLLALKAEDYRSIEEALARKLEKEGVLAVEAEARQLHEKWPNSELVHRIMRQAGEKHRQIEISNHLEAAEGAFAQDDFLTASKRWQQALEAGCDASDLESRIREAKRSAKEQQDREALEAAIDRFHTQDAKSALLGYLALDRPLRSHLCQRVDRQTLTWLDQISSPTSGSRAHAAVTAVLALESALELRRKGEIDSILTLLEPHQPVLEGIDEARLLIKEMTSQQAEECRQRALQLLDQTQAAFDVGDLDRSLELLEHLDSNALDATDRSRPANLRRQIDNSKAHQVAMRDFERHLAAGDLLGALRRGLKLRDASAEDDRASWDERLDEIRGSLGRNWGLDVCRQRRPLADCPLILPRFREECKIWLDDQASELVITQAWKRWIFIWLIDVDHQYIETCVSFAVPLPLGDVASSLREADRLWIAGELGGIIEFDLERFLILDWWTLQDLSPDCGPLEEARLVPGAPSLWIQGIELKGREPQWVVDLKKRQISRNLSGRRLWALPMLGTEEPSVISYGLDSNNRLYTDRGMPKEHGEVPARGPLCGAAIDPDGRGLIITVQDSLEIDKEGWLAIRWSKPSDEGAYELASEIKVDNAFLDEHHPVATSLDQGLSFVLSHTIDSDLQILTLKIKGDELVEVDRFPVPLYTELVQDRKGRHVVLLTQGTDRLHILRMTSDLSLPKRIFPLGLPADDWPALSPPLLCDHIESGVSEYAETLRMNLRSPQSPLSKRFIKQFLDENASQPEKFAALYWAMTRSARFEEASSLLCRFNEEHPSHVGLGLLRAEMVAREKNWSLALKVLEKIKLAEDTNEKHRAHYYHLLGLSLLRHGTLEEAREAFRAGTELESNCQFDRLLALTDPEISNARARSGEPSWARQLVGALLEADRALAENDPKAAVEVLENPAVLFARELQSAARLVAAYLQMGSPDGFENFKKRRALAYFQSLFPVERWRRELVYPGLQWNMAKLEDLSAKAGKWLDANLQKS